MANRLNRYALGRWVQWCALENSGENIMVTLLKSAGLPTDANFITYQSVAALLSAGAVRADFTNYADKALTQSDISIVVNLGTGVTTVDTVADPVWNAAGGAANNGLGKILFSWRRVTSDAESLWRPITWHDFVGSTTAGNLTAQIPSGIGSVGGG